MPFQTHVFNSNVCAAENGHVYTINNFFLLKRALAVITIRESIKQEIYNLAR
jgi:hypothetical protein